MCSLTRFQCSQPVTALTISLTGSLLLVGTATGLVHLYDIASHQLLRTISTHKGMSISHLATMLKPPDLIGHVSLSLNVGSFSDAKDVIPVRPVVPFHRMKDAKARDAHEVMMMLPVQIEVRISSDQTNSTAYAGIDPWRHTQRV
jgi:pre-rRNA-processing protein IPI3